MVMSMSTSLTGLRWFINACTIFVITGFLCQLRPYSSALPSHLYTTATAKDLHRLDSVYIASIQWNSAAILETYWIPALLKLIRELQAVDITVYVSIYESGSQDGIKDALSHLAESLKYLNISNTITLDNEMHAEVIDKAMPKTAGWLKALYGKELRRMLYLANVRNRALEPLYSLNKAGIRFDKLLYLNDVVFSVRAVLAPNAQTC